MSAPVQLVSLPTLALPMPECIPGSSKAARSRVCSSAVTNVTFELIVPSRPGCTAVPVSVMVGSSAPPASPLLEHASVPPVTVANTTKAQELCPAISPSYIVSDASTSFWEQHGANSPVDQCC